MGTLCEEAKIALRLFLHWAQKPDWRSPETCLIPTAQSAALPPFYLDLQRCRSAGAGLLHRHPQARCLPLLHGQKCGPGGHEAHAVAGRVSQVVDACMQQGGG